MRSFSLLFQTPHTHIYSFYCFLNPPSTNSQAFWGCDPPPSTTHLLLCHIIAPPADTAAPNDIITSPHLPNPPLFIHPQKRHKMRETAPTSSSLL